MGSRAGRLGEPHRVGGQVRRDRAMTRSRRRASDPENLSPAAISREMRRLLPLTGSWSVKLRWSPGTHRLVGGPIEVDAHAEIRFLEGGAALHYRMGPSHWLIGGDEQSREYTVLYADDRPVSRVYRMTFRAGVWRIWRNAPGFSQRFEARVQRGGRRIVGHWDRSEGNRKWVRDFDLRFVREAPGGARERSSLPRSSPGLRSVLSFQQAG